MLWRTAFYNIVVPLRILHGNRRESGLLAAREFRRIRGGRE